MNPVEHIHCNRVIPPAPGDEGTVNPLHVRIDEHGFTSYWKPSPSDLEILNAGGTVAMLTAAPRLIPARLYVVAEDGSTPDHLSQADVALEICLALDELRKDPGETLIIHSDNDDFNGKPPYLIACCGDWTDWEEREFAGDHWLTILREALLAKRTWRAKNPHGLTDPKEG